MAMSSVRSGAMARKISAANAKGARPFAVIHIFIRYGAQLLVKLMASIFGYIFRDKPLAIARMTMVVEKPRMRQSQGHRTNRGNCPLL